MLCLLLSSLLGVLTEFTEQNYLQGQSRHQLNNNLKIQSNKFLISPDIQVTKMFLFQQEDSIDNTFSLNLSEQENFYLAVIQVGTPPQNFSVLIDTGSPNFILTSNLCQQVSCHKHGSYNPQLSSTSYYIEAIKLANGDVGNLIDIQFATGRVEGVFFEDKVCINNLCVEDQFIIGIIQETEDIFSQMKFDGILGLGRVQEAVVANASLLHNLRKKQGFNNFSLYLSSQENDFQYSSQLVLGGISQKLLQTGSHFQFFQVTTKHLWTIAISAIYLGKQRIDNCDVTSCQGLIDSGTSYLAFSDYPMNILIHKYGSYQQCDDLKYLPDLTFVFDDGVQFSLKGDEYFKKNSKGSVFNTQICVPYVKPSPSGSKDEQLFVLGQPFLKKHYIWFDEERRRVGIARSNQSGRN